MKFSCEQPEFVYRGLLGVSVILFFWLSALTIWTGYNTAKIDKMQAKVNQLWSDSYLSAPIVDANDKGGK